MVKVRYEKNANNNLYPVQRYHRVVNSLAVGIATSVREAAVWGTFVVAVGKGSLRVVG